MRVIDTDWHSHFHHSVTQTCCFLRVESITSTSKTIKNGNGDFNGKIDYKSHGKITIKIVIETVEEQSSKWKIAYVPLDPVADHINMLN